jgi:ATP-dependent exoDNAse (exonuclease V) beta subunit
MPEPWQVLTVRNHHSRDKYIVFDEPSHTYTVHGSSKGYISCTKFIHEFFPHFDADAVIKKMMRSPKWPANKLYGKTADEIKELWASSGREASGLGTAMHLGIEQFLNGADAIVLPEIKNTPEWRFFQNFWADHGGDLEPYRMEWEVFVQEIKLAGSIDGVFRRRSDGRFVIYDWKRSKEIKKDNPYESGYPPLHHLPNTNYWHYTMQLNVYRWILKNYYRMDIADLYLIILHPNNSNYVRMRLNILEDEVLDMVEARQRAVDGELNQAVVLPMEAHDDEENCSTSNTSCIIRI